MENKTLEEITQAIVDYVENASVGEIRGLYEKITDQKVVPNEDFSKFFIVSSEPHIYFKQIEELRNSGEI